MWRSDSGYIIYRYISAYIVLCKRIRAAAGAAAARAYVLSIIRNTNDRGRLIKKPKLRGVATLPPPAASRPGLSARWTNIINEIYDCMWMPYFEILCRMWMANHKNYTYAPNTKERHSSISVAKLKSLLFVDLLVSIFFSIILTYSSSVSKLKIEP